MSTLKCLSTVLSAGLLLGLGLVGFLPTAHAHRPIPWPSSNPIYLGPVSIQVKSGSRVLPSFVHNSGVYVLGSRGVRYSIFVKNRTSQRIEVVASVDGRDVISGSRTRGFHRRGYVLNPYKYVDISGFRTSSSTVAAFRFSSIQNAYAVRRGSSWWRVGSLHIALFRERRSIAYIPQPLIQGRSHNDSTRKHPFQRPSSPSSVPPRRKSMSGAADRPALRHRGGRAYHRRHYRRPYQPGLGTAYGEQRHAPASFTTFVRASSSPSHQLTIGYNNCAGFRSKRMCSRWCRCYPLHWHHHRRHRHPHPLQQNNPRYAPPPSN